MKTDMLVLMVAAAAAAQDESVVRRDWGSYMIGEHVIVVNLAFEITQVKSGFQNSSFAQGGRQAALKKATPEAAKALGILWEIRGINDIKYSTYSVVINKAIEFKWSNPNEAVAAEDVKTIDLAQIEKVFADLHATAAK